jgi:predicted porin
MNKQQHVVARVSYPFKIGSQMIEPGIQGYSGKYVMFDNQLTSGITTNADKNYTDRRAAVSFVLYPKPFGIQAEYNIGEGPQFDRASQSIKVKSLDGGYATFSYRLPYKTQFIFPFMRYQYYRGGKKFELDARSYAVNQFDFGIEYQFNKSFELTAEYVISDRRYEDFALQNNHQTGNLLRIQAQMNF